MLSAGMVGLFLGPVLLAVAYQLFMDGMSREEVEPAGKAAATAESYASPLEAPGD